MVSEGGRSEYGRGYVCTRCFASVERYIALKIKYIELEAALMSKMSGRGIATVTPIPSERSIRRKDSVA